MLPRWYRPPLLPAVSARQIIEQVAALYRLTPAAITGRGRKPHLCAARWQVMRELRARGMSLPRIGDLLGRDHSTVLHGLRRAG